MRRGMAGGLVVLGGIGWSCGPLVDLSPPPSGDAPRAADGNADGSGAHQDNASPCNTPSRCGPDCEPCGGETPDCGGATVGCVCNAISCGAGHYCEQGVCQTCQPAGQTCAGDEQCCSLICGTDGDLDGFFSEAAGHTGTCQTVSKPYTDCYDGNSEARPDQTLFSDTDRGDGSFDWDCDGVEQKRWSCLATLLSQACTQSCPSGIGGWHETIVPGCGAYGNPLLCYSFSDDSCGEGGFTMGMCAACVCGSGLSWDAPISFAGIPQMCR